MNTLEFFFDYASPYSYLASSQVEKIAQQTGASLSWRPFFLGGVFKATGNSSPALVPNKAIYMLQDLLRWTRHYGLPDFTLPDPFPARSITSLRLALVAQDEGKLPSFSHLLYQQIFALGKDQAQVAVLTEVIREAGMDPDACIERAGSQEIKDRLRKNTEEAVERGSFGAPTFFVGEQMFIGNDRLGFVERALRESA
jgi:2-hydroxychromene-2-carboxylate isomerase